MNVDNEKCIIVYDSYEEFFTDVISTSNLYQRLYAGIEDYVYRGVSSDNYALIPSVLRKDNTKRRLFHTVPFKENASVSENQEVTISNCEYTQIAGELQVLSDFYKKANDQGLWLPECTQLQSMYDQFATYAKILKDKEFIWYTREIAQLAGLAQHSGLATRMLDWSQDLLTAVYFAAHGACKQIFEKSTELGKYIVIWLLNRKMIGLQFKNPYPLKIIVPSYYDNCNLRAQKGILSYWEMRIDSGAIDQLRNSLVDRTPLDEKLLKFREYKLKEFPLIYKLMIPIGDCKNALSHIRTLGYCSAKLYPGYDGVIQQLDDETMINSI